MPSIAISDLLEELSRGRIPAVVYSDPELYELEKERVFARCWVYLAHESEIPDPGDYVVRRIVDDSFIVIRDEDGVVRVLFNMCLHRGMQLCRAELGNTSHFRCPYHGWTYRNTGELVGVPFHKDAYGGDAGLDREAYRLLRPARTGSYAGLVFACLDPAAPELDDYLGGFRYYLDFYLRQSAAGAEVHGPQRWLAETNWKIGAENFCGDSYHTPHTHRSIVDIELFAEPRPAKRKEGALYFADVGGGTTYKLPPGDFHTRMRHVGYPDEMIDRAQQTWSDEQVRLVKEAGFMPSAATLLPNLSFVHNWPQVDADGLIVPFISLRLWQPVSPTRTEIFSWFVVDQDAPDWFKEASRKAYVMSFGSSGMFEQDDVENWVSITQVAKGMMARDLRLHNAMGLDADGAPLHPSLSGWPGPGQAYQGYGEYNQRALLKLWGELIATRADESDMRSSVTIPERA